MYQNTRMEEKHTQVEKIYYNYTCFSYVKHILNAQLAQYNGNVTLIKCQIQ